MTGCRQELVLCGISDSVCREWCNRCRIQASHFHVAIGDLGCMIDAISGGTPAGERRAGGARGCVGGGGARISRAPPTRRDCDAYKRRSMGVQAV